MKWFKNLQFTNMWWLQAVMEFDNWYWVSVKQLLWSYTNEEKLYELAIKKNWLLCYSSWITDDVLRYLNESEVTEYMKQVQQLDNEPELVEEKLTISKTFNSVIKLCPKEEEVEFEEDESFSRDICDHDYPVWFVEGERVLAKRRGDEWQEEIYLYTCPWKAYGKYIVVGEYSTENYNNWKEYDWDYCDEIKKLPKTLDWTTRTIEGNEYLLSLVTKD